MMDNTRAKLPPVLDVTCGVERTYQRRRELSPLSLDAARAAELGLSYGQYKAREVV